MTRCRILALLLSLAGTAPASAHLGPPAAVPPIGIEIAGITHGQMAVVADHLSGIRRLAGRQIPADPVQRRLQSYVDLQSFACVFVLVPGAIGDDASPFNECAHATLAGGLALLLHLRQVQGDRGEAAALAASMDREMLDHGASLTLCRYSDEGFSTGRIIWPDWRAVLHHPPSLLTFATPLALLLAAGLLKAAARQAQQSRP